MGYRSDIVIAVHKNVITMDLITPIIPQCLKDEPYTDTELGRYWSLQDWKWYPGYKEIDVIENMFDDIEALGRVDPTDEFSSLLYGATRVGENMGDVEQWGDPFEYGIYAHQIIYSPVTD